jgi:hypothetical protein
MKKSLADACYAKCMMNWTKPVQFSSPMRAAFAAVLGSLVTICVFLVGYALFADSCPRGTWFCGLPQAYCFAGLIAAPLSSYGLHILLKVEHPLTTALAACLVSSLLARYRVTL